MIEYPKMYRKLIPEELHDDTMNFTKEIHKTKESAQKFSRKANILKENNELLDYEMSK